MTLSSWKCQNVCYVSALFTTIKKFKWLIPLTKCFGNIRSSFLSWPAGHGKFGILFQMGIISSSLSNYRISEGTEIPLWYLLYYMWLQGGLLHEFLTFPLQFEPLKQLQCYCLFFFPFSIPRQICKCRNASEWKSAIQLPYPSSKSSPPSALVTLKFKVWLH